eukprot:2443683-Prymnesium_polylepis.2
MEAFARVCLPMPRAPPPCTSCRQPIHHPRPKPLAALNTGDPGAPPSARSARVGLHLYSDRAGRVRRWHRVGRPVGRRRGRGRLAARLRPRDGLAVWEQAPGH